MAFCALILLPLIVRTVAQGDEVKGPVNTVSFVGSQITLTCVPTTENCINVEWFKFNPGASQKTVFQLDGHGGIHRDYRDRFSVDNSTGCHLVIRNVQLTDAGRFTCRDLTSSNTVEKDAYLILLEAEPKCSINSSQNNTVEGDGVRLTCEVTYNGTENVSMLWKDVEDAPPAVKRGKTTIRSYSVGSSAPEVPSFTCITSIQVMTAAVAATNTPSITCKTPSVEIIYPVRNAYLSPSLSNYLPGSNITCLAEGRPSPSFHWQIQENGNDGSWKAIPNETRSQLIVHTATSSLHRCVAWNTVRGSVHSVVSHTFQVNDTGPLYVILVAVGASVGLVLLVAVCCSVRRCKGPGRSPERGASERVTVCAMGQGESKYLNMGKSNNTKETFGYVDVHRPLSDESCNSEFTD